VTPPFAAGSAVVRSTAVGSGLPLDSTLSVSGATSWVTV
jgi:hypothetical protein